MQATPRPSPAATKRPATRRASPAKAPKPVGGRKAAAPETSFPESALPQGSLAQASPADTTARDELIRQAAWSFYEQRGCLDGYDLEDWLSAEALITQRLALDGPDHSPRSDRITRKNP